MKEKGKSSRKKSVSFEKKFQKEEEPDRYLPGYYEKNITVSCEKYLISMVISIDRVCVPDLEKL